MKKTAVSTLVVILFVTAILLPLKYIWISAAVGIIALALLEGGGLKRLKSKYLWIFLILIALIQPLITGNRDSEFLGIAYSARGLELGLRLSLRALTIISAMSLLFSLFKGAEIEKGMAKIGLVSFGEVFNESQKQAGAIEKAIRPRFEKWSLRKSLKFFVNPANIAAGLLAEIIISATNPQTNEIDNS